MGRQPLSHEGGVGPSPSETFGGARTAPADHFQLPCHQQKRWSARVLRLSRQLVSGGRRIGRLLECMTPCIACIAADVLQYRRRRGANPAGRQSAVASSRGLARPRPEDRRELPAVRVVDMPAASASRSAARTRRAVFMARLMFASWESSSKNRTTSQVGHCLEKPFCNRLARSRNTLLHRVQRI
jgi:hypothetical protein